MVLIYQTVSEYLEQDSTFEKAFLDIIWVIFGPGIKECRPRVFRDDIIGMTIANILTHSGKIISHLF